MLQIFFYNIFIQKCVNHSLNSLKDYVTVAQTSLFQHSIIIVGEYVIFVTLILILIMDSMKDSIKYKFLEIISYNLLEIYL